MKFTVIKRETWLEKLEDKITKWILNHIGLTILIMLTAYFVFLLSL